LAELLILNYYVLVLSYFLSISFCLCTYYFTPVAPVSAKKYSRPARSITSSSLRSQRLRSDRSCREGKLSPSSWLAAFIPWTRCSIFLVSTSCQSLGASRLAECCDIPYFPPISRLYFETLRFTFSFLFLMADMLAPGRPAARDARCDPLQNIPQLLKGEVSVRSSSRSSAPNPRRLRLEVR
jgi:hypothetical protein